LNVIIISVIMLSVAFFIVIRNVIVLSVVMRNVVKLSVVAPKYRLQLVQKSCDWLKVHLHYVFLNCDLTKRF